MAEMETQPIPGTQAVLEDDTPSVSSADGPGLFEAEMNPHLDALYRNALRLTGNANDAEDLLQDTYLRAYRFFYQYQPGTNAKAWLFRIMNTVFLNDYRRKSRQGETVSYDGLEDFLSVQPSDRRRGLRGRRGPSGDGKPGKGCFGKARHRDHPAGH